MTMSPADLNLEINRRIDDAIQQAIQDLLNGLDRDALFASVLLHYRTTGMLPEVNINIGESAYIKSRNKPNGP